MRSVNLRLKSSTGCQRVKHGPKTILLKLLTILLSGSPFRWWTRQQLTAGPIRQQSQLRRLTLHARHRFRATSARIAALAGINQFQMFATVSIKKNSLGNKDQVISGVVSAVDGCWHGVHLIRASSRSIQLLVLSGPSMEAASCKRQATSSKRQAPSSDIQEAFEPTWLSIKRQASSPKLQASSFKPCSTRSKIREPRYM